MKKVLITGITGFIGSYLSQYLSALDYEVKGTSTRIQNDSVFKCQLDNKHEVETVLTQFSPDIIIHCAALSSVTRGQTIDYYVNNVIATENLIECANKLPNLERFIFLSTAGVYGNQAGHEVLHENLCPNPISHYGMSKFVCEKMCWGFFKDPSIVTIVRPFNVIGTGQNADFIIPKLVSHFIQNKKSIRLGNINTYRDYIDIYTSCELIHELILSTEARGEIVNLCTGQGHTVAELIAVLEKIYGYKIEVITDPKFVRKNEVWKLIGSVQKLEQYIGKPVPQMNLHKILSEMK